MSDVGFTTKAKAKNKAFRAVSNFGPVKKVRKELRHHLTPDALLKTADKGWERIHIDVPKKDKRPDDVAKWLAETAGAREVYKTEYMTKYIPLTKESVTNTATAIRALGVYDFIQATESGQHVLTAADDLDTEMQDFFDNEVHHFENAMNYIEAMADIKDISSDEYKQLFNYASTFNSRFTSIQAGRGRLRAHSINYVASASEVMNSQAVKAWVRMNPGKSEAFLDGFLKGVDGGLTVGADAAGPYKGVVIAVKSLKAIVDRQARAALTAHKVKKQMQEHTGTWGRALMTKNPALMANRVAQKQYSDLTEIVGLLDFVGGWLPAGVWKIISTNILRAGKAYFYAPVKKLEDELGIKKTEKDAQSIPDNIAAQAEKYMEKAIEDGAEKATESAIKQMLQQAMSLAQSEAGPEGFGADGGQVANYIIKKIMKKFPNHPAQRVDGVEIETKEQAMGAALSMDNIRVKHGLSEVVLIDGVKRATQTKDGKNIVHYLQDQTDEDGDGKFFWVEIEGGEKGRMRQSDLSFKAEDGSAAAAMFPTEDDMGNPVGKVYRAVKENGQYGRYEVRVGDVKGLLDAKTKKLTVTGPAPEAVDWTDWAGLMVDVDEIEDDSGSSILGKWYKIDGSHYMFFETVTGSRLWAVKETKDCQGVLGLKFLKTDMKTRTVDELRPVFAGSVA